MREYAKVSDLFWTGNTGRKICKMGQEVQLAALYIITGPLANMYGVYYLPAVLLSHAVGSTPEGALKGLRSLSEGGFCTYDEESEWIWVYEMARYQVGDALSESDNRVKGIAKWWLSLPELPFLNDFYKRYAQSFHLPNRSPLEAPSKPLRSQEQEQEQEQKKELRESDKSAPPTCPHQKIIALYHKTLPMLPGVMESIWQQGDGANDLRQRWKENKNHQNLEFWQGFFSAVAKNDWWVNSEQWGKANLQWLIKKKRFYKVIEYWSNLADTA